MKKLAAIIAITLVLLASCTQEYKPLHDATIRHASLLKMQTLPHERTLCRIANPWIPEQTAIQYLLVETTDSLFTTRDLQQIEKEYGEVLLLRTPLCRQALTASCHGWLLGQLEALDGVAVMCDAGYVLDSLIKQRICYGTIADGGSSMSPNIEVLLSAQCDALWMSPFENASPYSHNERFQIPEIYCADYMETSPLARAEWMRFYGRLVGKTAESDSLFQLIEYRYDSIAREQDTIRLTSGFVPQKLLCETPYVGTWYVPGGRSTVGLLYQDAGFEYPWSSDTHSGSLALSPEAVFQQAGDADIWIFKYNDTNHDLTLEQLKRQHPFFTAIKAVQGQRVYACNTARSNFFDITPFRPDLLLQELATLANLCGSTSQNNNDSLQFFHPLSEK